VTLPAELRQRVRARANFACEFCGVTESDTGGELTIDHFQPQAHGGSDDPDNLLYSCYRCNQYKAHYWPAEPGDAVLWNPRSEARDLHLSPLGDGRLVALTGTGAFTLKRLRLNRPALVAHRAREAAEGEQLRLLDRYRELVRLLEQMHEQRSELLAEQRELLEEQCSLLRLLLERRG
jgi:HNH endonuclease